MQAIVQDRYGSAEVLELRDMDRPSIGDDEVLVRVRAAYDQSELLQCGLRVQEAESNMQPRLQFK